MSESTSPYRRRFLTPRFWPVWLGLGILRVAASLPHAWQLTLGKGLGNLLHRVLPRRRAIAATNIALCFPERSATDQRQLVKAHFQASGMALFETALGWWGTEDRLTPLMEIDGVEHLDEALAQGRGAILLSGHFTTLELAARLLASRTQFCVMYRPAKNPLINAFMHRSRNHRVVRAFRRDQLRGIVRALKAGYPVWYAPDQDLGRKHSVFAPFFGVTAATVPATARLARMSGAPVVPYFPMRTAEGRYQLVIRPPLTDFPSGDDEADAARVNALIEDQVRACPEQYWWVHRRFKTPPPGGTSPY